MPPRLVQSGEVVAIGDNADQIVATFTRNVVREKIASPAYGPTVRLDLAQGTWQVVKIGDTNPFTIVAPKSLPVDYSASFVVELWNNTPGAAGAISWDPLFLMASAYSGPPTGKSKWISFAWNGRAWVELARSGSAY